MSRRGVAVGVVLAAGAAFGLWALLGHQDGARAPEAASEDGRVQEAGETKVPGLLARPKGDVGAPTGTPLSLTGSVTDGAGAAVAGVRVTARRTGAVWDANDPKTWGGQSQRESILRTLDGIDSPGKAEPAPDAETKSAADGTFGMKVYEPGNYEVAARPEPPLAGTRASVPLTAAKPEGKVRLKVLAGSAFRGRVVDATDHAVLSTVRATMTTEEGTTSFAPPPVLTDAGTGEFAWDAVPAGKLSLSVVLPGRMSLSGIEVAVPHEGVFTIRIAGGGTLRGKVSNLVGEAVAGADVVAMVKGTGDVSWVNARAKTGPDGQWRMEGIPPGPVQSLSVVAQGYTALQQSNPRAPWNGAEVKAGEETTIDVVLKKGGTVLGRVTEKGSGAPVPDVDIQLSRAEMTGYYGPPAAAATDAEGRFRFDDVALGKYLLVPQSATHWFAPVEAAVAGSSGAIYDPSGASVRPTPPSLTVVLAKEGETAERDLEAVRGLPVHGRVVGPDGQPVGGATVTSTSGGLGNVSYQWGVQVYGNQSGTLATSGADGTFAIPGVAPREAWVFVAVKDDFVGVPSDPVKVSAGASTPEVTLKLAVGASVSGRVLDDEGKGFPGWTVWCWPMEAGGFRGNTQTTSDSEGAFTIRGLPAGKVQMQAWSSSGSGGSTQTTLDPPLAAGEKRQGVEIRIARGVEVSGTLVDADGKPVSGQWLSASAMGGGARWSAGTSTKSDGSFVLKGVAKGKVQMNLSVAIDTGYGESVVVGDPIDAPASGVRLVWTPRKKTTIAARITDGDGRPIPLVLVTIEGRSRPNSYGQGNPDEVVNGEMVRSVDGTPPFTLVASYPRDAWGRPLNLKPKKAVVADPAVTAVIVMEAGVEIAGTVVGPDGKGVPASTVSGGGVQTSTDEEGRFRLSGLPSDADVDLAVRPPTRFIAPPPTRAKPGVVDLVIRLALGATISGRVVGPDGSPAKNASVSAQWKSPATGRTGFGSSMLQEGGRFRIEGLADDAVATVNVQSWSPAGGETLRPAQVENVRAGTDDLLVRLEAGVSIEGKVVYADGRPAAFSWIQLARPDRPGTFANGGQVTDAAAGTFKAAGLEPGTYLLTVMSQRGAPMGEPTRVDAPARDVRIVVATPVRLAGRVEGAMPGIEYWVVAWPADGPPDVPSRAQTKLPADGTFALDVPAEKDLYVAVMYSPEDRYALLGPVRPGAGDVVLRFQPGASIDGVLEDSTGAPKAGGWVFAKSDRWRATAKTDADGRFRLRGLPPGKFTLSSQAASGSPPATLGEADAGATGLHLRLPQ